MSAAKTSVGAFVLALLMILLVCCAGNKSIAAGGSTSNVLNFHVYQHDVREIDPFADELGITDAHNHALYGNRAISQNVSATTLLRNNEGSASGPSWATNAAWRPIIEDQDGPLAGGGRAKFYYRLGDATPKNITHLPNNAKMLGTDEFFSCNNGPDRQTPPLGCEGTFKVKVLFPQCYNPNRGNVPQAYTYPNDNGSCGNGRYVPELTFNLMFNTGGDGIDRPLRVSAGHESFNDYRFMHADEWATYQQPRFRNFMEDCVFKGRDVRLPAKCKPSGNENL